MRIILTSLILLISVAASEGASLQSEWVSPSITYWHEKLPMTAIPETLRELISTEDEKVAMNVGTLPRKTGPPARNGVPTQVYVYSADAQMAADPSLLMFLLEKDLHSGTKMSLRLLQESIPNTQKMHFLPRAVADQIPFSSDKISLALKELNIVQDSDTALAMKETLQDCESPAVKGESKFCATSLESMIDYGTLRLGSNRVIVLATNVPKTSKSGKQEYSLKGVKYVSKVGEKSVVCHRERYAYAVYYCHETQGTRTARVWVKGEDGSKDEVLALCHADTSAWNPNHVAFKVLNVKPGASVCHFLPQAHVVWLPAN